MAWQELRLFTDDEGNKLVPITYASGFGITCPHGTVSVIGPDGTITHGDGESCGHKLIDLLAEQPMPKRDDGGPSIQDMVIADMEVRKQVGLQRCTLLRPNNGRDMLRDAYKEALNLAIYLRGAIAERDRS